MSNTIHIPSTQVDEPLTINDDSAFLALDPPDELLEHSALEVVAFRPPAGVWMRRRLDEAEAPPPPSPPLSPPGDEEEEASTSTRAGEEAQLSVLPAAPEAAVLDVEGAVPPGAREQLDPLQSGRGRWERGR